MADSTISNLTAVTAPLSTDVTVIVNSSTTKKVTIANLVANSNPASLAVPIIKAQADGVTAIQITKADGTTAIVNIDSTNLRVGINAVAPQSDLELKANTPLLTFNQQTGNSEGGIDFRAGTSLISFIHTNHSSGLMTIDSGPAAFGSQGILFQVDTGNVMQLVRSDGNGGFATPSRGAIKMTNGLIRGWVGNTSANYSVLNTDTWISNNVAGTVTLTLGTAVVGRELYVRTVTNNTVVSAGSNVIPLIGGSAGTAILAATAGKWATLVGDGTNWVIMAAN